MSWVYFLKFKLETFENFKKFKALAEKQSGCSIKSLHSDRGGEFTSNEFVVFYEKNGIYGKLTTPRTPEQNEVAERKIVGKNSNFKFINPNCKVHRCVLRVSSAGSCDITIRIH